jgi:hypothetical protein
MIRSATLAEIEERAKALTEDPFLRNVTTPTHEIISILKLIIEHLKEVEDMRLRQRSKSE